MMRPPRLPQGPIWNRPLRIRWSAVGADSISARSLRGRNTAHPTYCGDEARIRSRNEKTTSFRMWSFISGASDEARTRYLHLGKVALYQMSYTRKYGAQGRNRTSDTRIFNPLLYQLSYLGVLRKGYSPQAQGILYTIRPPFVNTNLQKISPKFSFRGDFANAIFFSLILRRRGWHR